MLLKVTRWCRALRKYSYEVGQTISEGSELIHPLIWKEAIKIGEPSSHFIEGLADETRERLAFILKEIELFSRLTPVFPENIDDSAWSFLLQCESRKQRLDHIIFLRKREKLRKRDAEVKKIRHENAEQREPLQWKQLVNWNEARVEKESKIYDANRMVAAFRLNDRPSLAVDCRFLEDMSPRAAQLTGAQLRYLVTTNKHKRNPWPLYFTNFDINAPSTSSVINRQIPFLNEKNVRSCSPIVTPFNYDAIFHKKKIIYLSPHAEEELTNLQEEDVLYVIGGIVDRVVEKGIHPQASRIAAEEDGVRCAKLPLDRFIEWKSGSKYLTLVAVANILYDVYETGGDWNYALSQHIPVRNVRGPEDKNNHAKEYHEKIREFNRQVLAIVDELLPQGVIFNK